MPLSRAAATRRLLRVALALTLVSCGGDGSDSSDVNCDRNPPFTYDNFGRGFMGKHCNGCHSSLVSGNQREGAPTGVDFDTYRGIVTWGYRIESRSVGEAGGMPPGGGPSEAEFARFQEWLECQVLRDSDALSAQGGR